MLQGCIQCGHIGNVPGKCPDCGDHLIMMFQEAQLYGEGFGSMKEYCEDHGIVRNWDRIAKLVGFDADGNDI